MSVLDITQINTKAEQPTGRAPASASNDSSQKFETVSHQENQRVERQRLEKQRRENDRLAQKRLEQERTDQQLQQRRKEQQRIEAARAEKNRADDKPAAPRQDIDATRKKNTEPARSETHKHNKSESTDKTASRSDSAKKGGEHEDENQVHADARAKQGESVHGDADPKTAVLNFDDTKTAQVAGESSDVAVDELPFLSVAVPVSQLPANIRNPSLVSSATKNGATGPAATINLLQGGDSNLSRFFSKLGGELSGDGSGGQKALGALAGGPGSDALSGFLSKGAAVDALKAGDFSTQLARFQGGSDNSSMQNNATSLQRGLDGRETLAPLKSYSTSVELPVQHAEWGEKIAGKLAWLTSQRMSAAEIHVTPPDLGPMQVRVQVHHDQAQVTVHAANHVVRDQLEQSGQRLRDMLQENGLNLDSFDVSSQAQSDGREGATSEEGEAGSSGSGAGFAGGGEPETDVTATGTLDLSLRGEVDTYV